MFSARRAPHTVIGVSPHLTATLYVSSSSARARAIDDDARARMPASSERPAFTMKLRGHLVRTLAFLILVLVLFGLHLGHW